MSTRSSTVSPLQSRVTPKAIRKLQQGKVNDLAERARTKDGKHLTGLPGSSYDAEFTATQAPEHIHLLFYITAAPEIYTLSLHDALPISRRPGTVPCRR